MTLRGLMGRTSYDILAERSRPGFGRHWQTSVRPQTHRAPRTWCAPRGAVAAVPVAWSLWPREQGPCSARLSDWKTVPVRLKRIFSKSCPLLQDVCRKCSGSSTTNGRLKAVPLGDVQQVVQTFLEDIDGRRRNQFPHVFIPFATSNKCIATIVTPICSFPTMSFRPPFGPPSTTSPIRPPGQRSQRPLARHPPRRTAPASPPDSPGGRRRTRREGSSEDEGG